MQLPALPWLIGFAALSVLLAVDRLPAQQIGQQNSQQTNRQTGQLTGVGAPTPWAVAEQSALDRSQIIQPAVEGIPLRRPSEGATSAPQGSASAPSWSNTSTILAVALALLAVALLLLRRPGGHSSGKLSDSAVKLLGRVPLTARQQLQLLHCGGKILLVAVSETSSTLLTEITDQDQVNSLIAACTGSPRRDHLQRSSSELEAQSGQQPKQTSKRTPSAAEPKKTTYA